MTYVLVFEYSSKNFMNIEKIIEFKKNYKKLINENKRLKMMFYGDASNEELAVFMSYFNNLIGERVCDFSISFKTKEIIFEKGINNKSVKLSSKNTKEIKNKNFSNIIEENYKEIELYSNSIKILPTKSWESIILDL